MAKHKKIYTIFRKVSALVMIVALVWLTVSAPFMLASQQELVKKQNTSSTSYPISDNEEETNNPLGSSGTEEKAPTSSSSFSEEYLHDHHITDHFFCIALQYYKCENAGTYIAFHGELLVPPPNAA